MFAAINVQDMKNAKSSLKKLAKSLEKEREKLTELEATPDRCQKEIADMEKKLKILEVCKMSQCEREAYTCVCVCLFAVVATCDSVRITCDCRLVP